MSTARPRRSAVTHHGQELTAGLSSLRVAYRMRGHLRPEEVAWAGVDG